MRAGITRFYHLNRMGRIEGPPLAGILLAAGAAYTVSVPTLSILLAAFMMYAVCMNYVYLVNGVTDVKEDAINSPERPLASGAISINEAWVYVNILFLITVMYPFFVHDSWSERGAIWGILILGYLYSCPPVRFKRNPPLATLYLVVNFNLPLVVGYWIATSSTEWPPFLLSTICLFFANMPLKDYGDRIGDEQAGVLNWVKVAGGTRNLLILSSILSVIGAGVCYVALPIDLQLRGLFVLLPLLPAINIVVHKVFVLNMDQMFTRGVRMLIALGILYIGFRWVF